ncbi:T-cell immunomodulatory protein homolog precursor [Plasmodium gonderi]|uniref:T-cell immunomodulatory protein homolog n=1 Tax=Plasmodium gonderi TaxID=77519 RepID=A0A1Y1JFG3_PLAGO|nr:T-cell immunomodulatory protein homolog precursor [Plasmodium gonderi]GAW81269.1 T-cell immunomodulatory protein homolog precursor [Plasmodium gonderi]
MTIYTKYGTVFKLLFLLCMYNIIKSVFFHLKGNEKTNDRKNFYVQANNWNLFEKWKSISPMEKLEYKINYNLGLNIDAEIGDFGDYNSDVKTDLILFNYDKNKQTSTIFIYIFSIYENKFIYHTEVSFEGQVVNVIAIDLNFDGALDVLVLFKDPKDSSKTSKYYISAFLQNENDKLEEAWNSKKKEVANEDISDGKNASQAPTVPASEKGSEKESNDSIYFSNIHPLVCDINNDGLPDLIGQQASSDSVGFSRFVWINKKGEFKSALWKNMNLFSKEDVDEITNPNSSAVVDINGDCKADLVFTVYNKNNAKKSTSLEIWLNQIVGEGSMYVKYKENYNLPSNSLQVLFGDFNGDGAIDIVTPTCTKSSYCNYCCVSDDKIYFIPNIQKKICDNSWQKPDESKCRLASNLCSESDFTFMQELNDDFVSIVDTSGLHLSGNADYPYYISVGDVDDDGFLDLLITLKNDKGQKYVRIYKNEQKALYEENNVDIRGFFNFYQFVTSPDETVTDVYNAAFFDIYENGVLDILIFGKYKTSNKQNKYAAVGFIRSNETDSLFLKSTALNGICVNDCYKEKDKITTKTLGGNAHGPTFKITVIDVNGVKSSRIGIQKSQSAHSPLQLPYVLFGLGRTSNYVEEFYVGMPTHEQKYYNMWVSIIPNSHIIVIPYPLENSNKWQIQLSVNPSKKFYSIIYITLICLTVIGILIFILDRREKVEDSKEEMGFKSHFVIG